MGAGRAKNAVRRHSEAISPGFLRPSAGDPSPLTGGISPAKSLSAPSGSAESGLLNRSGVEVSSQKSRCVRDREARDARGGREAPSRSAGFRRPMGKSEQRKIREVTLRRVNGGAHWGPSPGGGESREPAAQTLPRPRDQRLQRALQVEQKNTLQPAPRLSRKSRTSGFSEAWRSQASTCSAPTSGFSEAWKHRLQPARRLSRK